MYNSIEQSDVCSKTSGSLQQYYKDEPAPGNNGNIIDFTIDNNNISLNFKQQITGQTENDCIKDIEIMVLKYPSNFWRALEILFINCGISLQLKLFTECILVSGTAANQVPTFMIIDTKFQFPVVTLSTQDYVKPLKQLESVLKEQLTRANINLENKIKYKHRYLFF